MSRLVQETLLTVEGWEALDLDKLADATDEERQAALLVAGHYQAVFTGSEQGKFVLGDLVQQYLVSQRVASPNDDLIAVGIRQGNQDVVHKILRFIEVARTGGAPT